jgi:hypothetical protein
MKFNYLIYVLNLYKSLKNFFFFLRMIKRFKIFFIIILYIFELYNKKNIFKLEFVYRMISLLRNYFIKNYKNFYLI